VADGDLAELFSEHGLSVERLRSQVSTLVPPSPPPLLAAPPFTPRALRSLDLAGQQALELGHEHIDATHVLLGLLVEGAGVGAQLLESAGIGLTSVAAIAQSG
jgi:ATP-dependent Clp protease ATP-binding subunit ClpC